MYRSRLPRLKGPGMGVEGGGGRSRGGAGGGVGSMGWYKWPESRGTEEAECPLPPAVGTDKGVERGEVRL